MIRQTVWEGRTHTPSASPIDLWTLHGTLASLCGVPSTSLQLDVLKPRARGTSNVTLKLDVSWKNRTFLGRLGVLRNKSACAWCLGSMALLSLRYYFLQRLDMHPRHFLSRQQDCSFSATDVDSWNLRAYAPNLFGSFIALHEAQTLRVTLKK